MQGRRDTRPATGTCMEMRSSIQWGQTNSIYTRVHTHTHTFHISSVLAALNDSVYL